MAGVVGDLAVRAAMVKPVDVSLGRKLDVVKETFEQSALSRVVVLVQVRGMV